MRAMPQTVDENDRPPAYSPSANEQSTAYMAAMTETETVVTRTTTITTFFPSFKRKRPGSKPGHANSQSPNRSHTLDISPTRSSTPPPVNPLLVNKALPAPPTIDDMDMYSGRDHGVSPSVTSTATAATPPPSRHTTLSLACASIGVGLTPVVPKEISSVLKMKGNTNSLSSQSPHGTNQRQVSIAPPPSTSHQDREKQGGSNTESRRRRGLSLSASGFSSVRPVDQQSPSDAAPSKSIPSRLHSTSVTHQAIVLDHRQPLRRSSFWRFRVTSLGSSHPSPMPPVPTSPMSRSSIQPDLQGNPTTDHNHSGPFSLVSQPIVPNSNKANKAPRGLRRSHSVYEPPRRNGKDQSALPFTSATPPTQLLSLSTKQSVDYLNFSLVSPRRGLTSGLRPRSQSASASNHSRLSEDLDHQLIDITEVPDALAIEIPINSRLSMPPHLLSSNQFVSSPRSSSTLGINDDGPVATTSGHTTKHASSSVDVGQLDAPELLLEHLMTSVSKSEAINALASSSSVLHVQALQAYLNRFDFRGDPIDIALRRMLMDIGLPKETQQIDRVMEAFAQRYSQCNPNLFVSEDHPYILAFSLIMLHTDYFNKSNKSKMSKADYVKNTQLPGITPEMLEYLYDNIIFAPFIFIEDPVDVNGQRGILSDGDNTRSSYPANERKSTNVMNLIIPPSKTKIDPYYLIANNLLDSLRIDVDDIVPPFDPFLYRGTLDSWDEKALREAFAHAAFIEVGDGRPVPEMTTPLHGLNVSGPGGLVVGSPMGVVIPSPLDSTTISDVWSLKVTKVGLLERKEDISEGGKRSSNRKWKEWSVILTGSQLLFFRDPNWALGLLSQTTSAEKQALFPHISFLRPDELLSLKDCVAVYDMSYTKHMNTLRFVMPTGRQFLIRANGEHEINEWIVLINYASAFRSAGIRIRTTTTMATTSEIENPCDTKNSATISDTSSDKLVVNQEAESIYSNVPKSEDIGSSSTLEALKLPFRPVKTKQPVSPHASQQMSSSLSDKRKDFDKSEPSRSMIIRHKILALDSKIITVESQLHSDLRSTRNLALLRPFQKGGREKIRAAVISISKRVQSLRLELAKLRSHRDILSCDLGAAEMESRDSTNMKIPSLFRQKGFFDTHSPDSHSGSTSSKPSASSFADSFHSAVETLGPLGLTDISLVTSSFAPVTSLLAYSRSQTSFLEMDTDDTQESEALGSSASFCATPEHNDVPTDGGDEEAEAWNCTRAANRVSLVQLPCDLTLFLPQISPYSTKNRTTCGLEA